MLKKLLQLLTPAEQKRAGLLLCMILVMALLDMVGVASIMPFMAVLGNPELVETNAFLNAAYTYFDFSNTREFLFALGILVFVLLVVSLAFKALTTYAQLRFALMREYSFELLALLVLINARFSVIVGLTIVLDHSLIFKSTRDLMSRIGKKRGQAKQGPFTAAIEAFCASKEVKISGLKQACIQRFNQPSPTCQKIIRTFA